MDSRSKKSKRGNKRGRGRGGTSTSQAPAPASNAQFSSNPEPSAGTQADADSSKEFQKVETVLPKDEEAPRSSSKTPPLQSGTSKPTDEHFPIEPTNEKSEDNLAKPSDEEETIEMHAGPGRERQSPEPTETTPKEILLDLPPTSSETDPRQGSPNPPSESGSGGIGGRRRRLSSIKVDDRVRRISIGIGGVPKRGYWAGLDDSTDSEDSLLAQSTRKRPSIFTLGPTLMGYNKRQWNILIVFALVDFLSSVLISIQPPLYPRLAETKFVSPTEYGSLFGVFEMSILILCPAFFNMLKKVNSKVMLISGIFINGICAILFSFLDEVPGKTEFLAFSFVLRIVEAAGDACCITSAFSIITLEFPDSVATTFASLEAFLGLGFILGPILAGALYELDGFTVPFLTFGILLICSGILAMIILPKQSGIGRGDNTSTGNEDKSGFLPGFLTLLQIPSVALSSFGILCAAISLGYLNCTLFAYIERFNLSALTIGGIFIINQGMYSVSAPIWNFLVNRSPDPKYIMVVGTVLIFGSFLLVGPAPFIPLDTQLEVLCAGLFIHGLGIGAIFVSGFILIMKDTIEYGFPDNESTYGYSSGLYTSVFTFGSFIGLTASGVLYDYVGFKWGSTFILGIHFILVLLLVIFLLIGSRIQSRSRNSTGIDEESQPLLLNAENSGIGTVKDSDSQLLTPTAEVQKPKYGSLEGPNEKQNIT